MNTIMTHDCIHEKLGSDKECIGLCDWGTFKKVYMCFESVVILKWGDMMISVIHILCKLFLLLALTLSLSLTLRQFN